jgi:hypothetical protein
MATDHTDRFRARQILCTVAIIVRRLNHRRISSSRPSICNESSRILPTTSVSAA